MKKLLLIFCLAATLVACSKNDDEPSGGNGGNSGNGGSESTSLNDTKYDWLGTFAQSTIIIDGKMPLQNQSEAYKSWMEKYGKEFKTETLNQGSFGIRSISGIMNLDGYTFSQVDKIASEYAGFTLTQEGANPGYDNFNATLFNLFSYQPIKGYMLLYVYNEEKPTVVNNWIVNLKFEFVSNNGSYSAPEGFNEWAEKYSQYLTYDYIEDDVIEKTWTFNLSDFDNEFIMTTIYPFLDFNVAFNTDYSYSAEVYSRNDNVLRRFLPGSYN